MQDSEPMIDSLLFYYITCLCLEFFYFFKFEKIWIIIDDLSVQIFHRKIFSWNLNYGNILMIWKILFCFDKYIYISKNTNQDKK